MTVPYGSWISGNVIFSDGNKRKSIDWADRACRQCVNKRVSEQQASFDTAKKGEDTDSYYCLILFQEVYFGNEPTQKRRRYNQHQPTMMTIQSVEYITYLYYLLRGLFVNKHCLKG